MIGDEGVEDLTVDISTTTSHKVPLFKLKAWLESSGRDPREAALKSKLKQSALYQRDLAQEKLARDKGFAEKHARKPHLLFLSCQLNGARRIIARAVIIRIWTDLAER